MRKVLKEHVDLLRLNQELFEEDKRRKEVDEFQNSNPEIPSHEWLDADSVAKNREGSHGLIVFLLGIMFLYCFWLWFLYAPGSEKISKLFFLVVSYFVAAMFFPFEKEESSWKDCEPNLEHPLSNVIAAGMGGGFVSLFIGPIANYTGESFRGSIFATWAGFLAIIMPWLMVVVAHVGLGLREKLCEKMRSVALLKNQPKPSIPPSVASLSSIPLPSIVMAGTLSEKGLSLETLCANVSETLSP